MNNQILQALFEILATAAATQKLLVEKGILTKDEIQACEAEMRDILKQTVVEELFGKDDARKLI